MFAAHEVCVFKTHVACDENTEQVGENALNLRLIMILSLIPCLRLNSFRFLNDLAGFNCGNLSTLNNRCKLVMIDTMFKDHLKKLFLTHFWHVMKMQSKQGCIAEIFVLSCFLTLISSYCFDKIKKEVSVKSGGGVQKVDFSMCMKSTIGCTPLLFTTTFYLKWLNW